MGNKKKKEGRMKRIFVLILSFAYLGASAGVTLRLHFCMDRFAGWSWEGKQEDACGKCGMPEKEKDGCCKEEPTYVGISDEHDLAMPGSQLPPVLVGTQTRHIIAPLVTPFPKQVYTSAYGPPGPLSVPVYLANCVFRI